jgi:hypothetical protein
MDYVPVCVDCDSAAPPAHSETTLTFFLKWRLSTRVAPDGRHLAEWRCPSCWARYKKTRRDPSHHP